MPGTDYKDEVILPDGPVSDATTSKNLGDPGDGNPIPVTESGYVPLGISGSENNTLPDPPRAGMLLEIFVSYITSDERTIDADSAINKAGNTRLVFDALREYIKLGSIETTVATFAWQVVSNDDVDLSSP